MKISKSLLMILLMTTCALFAQDGENCTLVGRWAHGPCNAIETAGTVVYFGDGGFIRIMDFADAENPVELGHFLTSSSAKRIIVQDHFLYYLDMEGAPHVVDISDPANAEELDIDLDVPYLSDMEWQDGKLYLAATRSALLIYDVSDPHHPALLGSVEAQYGVSDLAVSGDHAFLAEPRQNLHTFDISDPAHPAEIGIVLPDLRIRSLEVSETLLYAAVSGSVRIFDISDISNPLELGSYSGGSVTYDIELQGNFMYAVFSSNGMGIADITNPASPVHTGSFYTYTNYGNAKILKLTGNLAFIGIDYGGLLVVDISDQAALSENRYIRGGYALDVDVDDDYAYVANGRSGLNIIDISEPSSPQLVGNSVPAPFVVSVSVIGDVAYVAASSAGLSIIDISDRANPVVLSTIKTRLSSADIALADNMAFLADRDSGLTIIDVSDRNAPNLVGSFTSQGRVMNSAISGRYAYLTDQSAGVVIVDISDAAHPVQAGTILLENTPLDVAVDGNRAYVIVSGIGLVIFDISDPAQPSEMGRFVNASMDLNKMEIRDGMAITSSGSGGVIIFDVSDPHAPTVIGSNVTKITGEGLAVRNNHIFLADGDDGLYIFSFETETEVKRETNTAASTFMLAQNYPNPFNPSTTIKFEIPRSAYVRLEVFDVRGRLVRALVDGDLSAGTHSAVFDVSDENGVSLPAGLYFYRLATGNEVLVKKATLVK